MTPVPKHTSMDSTPCVSRNVARTVGRLVSLLSTRTVLMGRGEGNSLVNVSLKV